MFAHFGLNSQFFVYRDFLSRLCGFRFFGFNDVNGLVPDRLFDRRINEVNVVLYFYRLGGLDCFRDGGRIVNRLFRCNFVFIVPVVEAFVPMGFFTQLFIRDELGDFFVRRLSVFRRRVFCVLHVVVNVDTFSLFIR